jgi:hypothetical protein
VIDADMLLLREAQANESTVEITVTDCLYGCCNRPPARRAGHLQVYRGVIAAVDERKLVLHSIALRSLNYHVVAELEHVEDVTRCS